MNKIPTAEMKLHETNTPTTPSPQTKPATMTKRIGGTTYQIAVHFSTTSTETMSDKISRLIKHEAASGKVVGF